MGIEHIEGADTNDHQGEPEEVDRFVPTKY
jgi:hypothetical protein